MLRINANAEAGTSARTALGTLGGPGPLEWYAFGAMACTVAAVLAYSAFFYHYPDFAAPWLAISAGYAAGAMLAARERKATAQYKRSTSDAGC